MTNTHKIIETIYKTVCNNFEIEWQDVQITNYGKFTGKSNPKARECRKIIGYLLQRHLTPSMASEICNVSKNTIRVYKHEAQDLMLNNSYVVSIIQNVNDKIKLLKQQNEVNFQP